MEMINTNFLLTKSERFGQREARRVSPEFVMFYFLIRLVGKQSLPVLVFRTFCILKSIYQNLSFYSVSISTSLSIFLSSIICLSKEQRDKYPLDRHVRGLTPLLRDCTSPPAESLFMSFLWETTARF